MGPWMRRILVDCGDSALKIRAGIGCLGLQAEDVGNLDQVGATTSPLLASR